MDAEAREILGAGRVVAMRQFPYYAKILSVMVVCERPGLGKFTVDARWRLYYDPQKCHEWSTQEIAAAWIHCVEHIFRQHARRFGELEDSRKDPALFQQCADVAINEDLKRSKMIMPEADSQHYFDAEAHPEWAKGMGAEEMYFSSRARQNKEAEEREAAEQKAEEDQQDKDQQESEAKDQDQKQQEEQEKQEGAEGDTENEDSSEKDPSESDSSGGSEKESGDPDSGDDQDPDSGPDSSADPNADTDGDSSDSEKSDESDSDGDSEDSGSEADSDSDSSAESESESSADSDSDSDAESGDGAPESDQEDPDADQDPGDSGEAAEGAQGQPGDQEGLSEQAMDCGSAVDDIRRDYEEHTTEDGSVNSVTAEFIKQEVASDIVDYANSQPGAVPNSLLREATQILEPQVDWRKSLIMQVRRGISKKAGQADRSYKKAARRSLHPKIIMPGRVAPPEPHIAVVLDTSGSMKEAEELSIALAEIENLLKSVARESESRSLTIINCDAGANAAVVVSKLSDFQIVGGGGTDMRVGINQAAREKPLFDIIMTVTDGGTPWPTEPPKENRIAKYMVCMVGRQARENIKRVPPWMTALEVNLPSKRFGNLLR